MAILNSNQQPIIGWRSLVVTQVVNAVDADAQAFITAAGITNLGQASAINTLVNDLKTYGLWTKMKAIYPFVGGTASSHKFNLKDARDLDAAYRLTFNGGGIHSSTGYAGNASNAWANTYLNAQSVLTNSNLHLSFYSRTASTAGTYSTEILSNTTYGTGASWISLRTNNKIVGGSYFSAGSDAAIAAYGNTLPGFVIGSETSSTLRKFYYNGNSVATNTTYDVNALPSAPITLLGYIDGANSGNESAFASIGDGLSDTEAANFYNSIQKFQTTLGRQVGVPIVADTDAQAFLNAAVITDLGQANAINTLVTDLKSAGVWTKMKALYPFVGGTATTHKFNLKDARDLDAAYRLVFSGGWTHSATGALPNGSTGYADTKLIPFNDLTFNSFHHSVYSRSAWSVNAFMGGCNDSNFPHRYIFMTNPNATTLNNVIYNNTSNVFSATIVDTQGLMMGNRTAIDNVNAWKNGVKVLGDTLNGLTDRPITNYYIGARNNELVPSNYDNKEYAFYTIGDGLSDAEATAFYTAVQKYQASLGRHVGTPIVSDTDAQAFINAAVITDLTQATAINTLVTNLKSAGIWTKMKAIYPFVGGTASSHKWNLKDPRDLDAAHRLVFMGGGTHSINGYQLNGSNSWGDTKFIPSTHWTTAGKSSFGLYSRTTSNLYGVSRYAMGSYENPGFIQLRLTDGTQSFAQNNVTWAQTAPVVANADKRGFFQSARNNSTTTHLYSINGTVYSGNSTYTGRSPKSIYIGTTNYFGASSSVENIQVAYSYIGEDLSETDLNNHYNIVQTYQTTLTRQINR